MALGRLPRPEEDNRELHRRGVRPYNSFEDHPPPLPEIEFFLIIISYNFLLLIFLNSVMYLYYYLLFKVDASYTVRKKKVHVD